MEQLYVIKIGGNVIDDEQKLHSFLQDFALLEANKILVHGGGKLASRMASQLNIPQQLVDGRRITDSETLKIVTMVYAGHINKSIVATLQKYNCNALGLCGADGNVILAHKRQNSEIDYGFVGDVDQVNKTLIKTLLDNRLHLVFSPVTHNQHGQLLNTNADTIAQELATALSTDYKVALIYSFEKAGVLLDSNDDATVISQLDRPTYQSLKAGSKIFAGMVPKLDNAFSAIEKGVDRVIIGKAENILQLVKGLSGTTITNE